MPWPRAPTTAALPTARAPRDTAPMPLPRPPSIARAAVGALLALTAPASAQLIIDEAPVVADFFQGPIVASSRVVGLGGAYIGVAEGAAGHLVNPVAFAVRAAPFAHDWFDWDVNLSWLNVSRDEQIDVGQTGRQTFDGSRFSQGGFNLKFGEHGFGAQVRSQLYDLHVDIIGEERTTVTFGQVFVGLGYAQHVTTGWWLGGTIYAGSAELRIAGDETARVDGGGLLLGALYAPPDVRWRFGLTARTPVVGRNASTMPAPGAVPPGLEVPDAVAVPWELGVGASYVFGPRGGNVQPTFGEGEPPHGPSARRYVLVAADVVITGPAPARAVGPAALFGGDDRQSGRYASLSLRAGAEAEVWADVLVLRAGGYFEPDRYAAFDGRVHVTGGADLHLGELIWDWEIGAVIDYAPAYLNWGLGLGFWY